MSNNKAKEKEYKEVQEVTKEVQAEEAAATDQEEVATPKVTVKVVEKKGLGSSIKSFMKKPAVKKVANVTFKGIKILGKVALATGTVLAALELNERRHPDPDSYIELDPDSYDRFIAAAASAADAAPALLEAPSNIVDAVESTTTTD